MSGPIIPHFVLFVFIILAILECVLQFTFETQRFGMFLGFFFSVVETFNELVSIHSSGFCCLVPEQSTGLSQPGKI